MDIEKYDHYIAELQLYKNKIFDVLKPVGKYAKFSDDEIVEHAEMCFELFDDKYESIFFKLNTDLNTFGTSSFLHIIYTLRRNNKSIPKKRTTIIDKIKTLKPMFKNDLLKIVESLIEHLKYHKRSAEESFIDDELDLGSDDDLDLDLDLDSDDDLDLYSEDDLDLELDLDLDLDDDDDLDLDSDDDLDLDDDDEIDELRCENEKLKDENAKINAELQAYKEAWANKKSELFKAEELLDEANKELQLAEKDLIEWDEFHKNIYIPLRNDHLKITKMLIVIQDSLLRKNKII